MGARWELTGGVLWDPLGVDWGSTGDANVALLGNSRATLGQICEMLLPSWANVAHKKLTTKKTCHIICALM